MDWWQSFLSGASPCWPTPGTGLYACVLRTSMRNSRRWSHSALPIQYLGSKLKRMETRDRRPMTCPAPFGYLASCPGHRPHGGLARNDGLDGEAGLAQLGRSLTRGFFFQISMWTGFVREVLKGGSRFLWNRSQSSSRGGVSKRNCVSWAAWPCFPWFAKTLSYEENCWASYESLGCC